MWIVSSDITGQRLRGALNIEMAKSWCMVSETQNTEQARMASGIDWANLAATAISQPDKICITARNQITLLADLRTRFVRRQGFTLATINLDHVVKIAHDTAFRRAYATHSHVTADGRPIAWLSRLAGVPVGLIPGSELVEPVAELAAELGVPVALMGSTEPALGRAGAALEERYPQLQIVVRIAPPMGFDALGPDGQTCIDQLATSGARLCFLALGAPKQELFAARAAEALPETGLLSIGAGLDFLSGDQTRAPGIIRKLALEWRWRLLGNPRRMFGRYMACFGILPRATVAALRARYIARG